MRSFYYWLVLAVAGQVAALSLISAGNQLRYQHYLPFESYFLPEQRLALAVISVQFISTLAGLWIKRHTFTIWLQSSFNKFTLVATALVFILSSATVSPGITNYLSELVIAAVIQLINLGNIVLLMMSIPGTWDARLSSTFNRVFGLSSAQISRLDRRADKFAGLAALWVICVAAFLSFFVYQRHPHVPDEAAYFLQARYLAEGRLVAPIPPVPDAFDFYLMQFNGDTWYPSPPAGWPAMLAVGVLLGAPWMVNPLLAGANIILIYLILKALYDQRLARIAVVLFCLSPWYLFMAMNYMTHIFTLTCALLAALWVMRCRESGQVRWAASAGLALGVMSLIRPLESLITAGLLGIWSIGIGGSRLKLNGLVAFVAVTCVVSLLVLPYNYQLTGDLMDFPINHYTDQQFGTNSNAYGFGPDRGMGWPLDPNPGHSPLDGLININLNTFSLNVELFGWSIGSLLILSLFVFSMRFQRSDYLMLAVILTVVLVFFPYYFSGGPDFGARYWFLIIVPLVALTASGIQLLESKIEISSPGMSSRMLAGVLVLGMISLFVFIPWRAVDKYYHYQGMRPDIKYLTTKYEMNGGLVLVSGNNHPDYVSAAVYNPIDVYSDDTIYVWDYSPKVRESVIKSFPGRPIWLVDGPSLTEDGYEIRAGPLSAAELSGGSISNH